jgi:hypothetical protein
MKWNVELDGGQLSFLHELVLWYVEEAKKPSLGCVFPSGLCLDVYDALQGAVPEEEAV